MTKLAKLFGLLLAALAVTVTVGACSGGSGGSSTAARADLAPAGAAARPQVAGSPADATGSVAHTTTGQTSLIDSTAKIRTAWMTVDVRGSSNVAAKANTADDIVQSVGGEIDSDDRTSGKHASAALQLRVPPAALTPVLDRLGRLGVEKSRRSSTTDVTERVADVDSRVQSARTAIAQLRALMRHAGKVTDLLSVENELSTREADLEALEAQQRSLTRQTALATITLTLRTAPVHTAVTKPGQRYRGFVGGLHRGWDGFVAAAVWTASAFATVLPFLALLILVIVALRVFGVRIPGLARAHRPTADPTT